MVAKSEEAKEVTEEGREVTEEVSDVKETEEGELTDSEKRESSSEPGYNSSDGIDDDENDTGSDDEEDVSFHKATILPVAPFDDEFDPSKKPVTGEEYLRMVRYEAKQLPFSQSIKPSSLPSDDDDHAIEKRPVELLANDIQKLHNRTPANRLPSAGFVDSFMDEFTAGCLVIEEEADNDDDDELHQDVDSSSWPNVDDEEAWKHTLYGITANSMDVSRSSKRSKTHSLNPQDIKTANLSPLIMGRLLHYHSSKWIPANRGDDLAARQYEFIISILQCLDPRTTPYQVVRLRALARLLLRQRAEAEDISEDVLQRTNGIIIAIAKRFGQSDLISPL